MEEQLTGFQIPCQISRLSRQLLKLGGVLIDQGNLQLQLLKVIPCSVFFCGILEPFMKGVQEVFPYYDAIIVCWVEGVKEFAEVLDPSSHLLAFDICQGEGGPGNVRLVCGYRPVQTKVEFEFVEEV